jgi:V/A-type H+-transporting ATPase subunit E
VYGHNFFNFAALKYYRKQKNDICMDAKIQELTEKIYQEGVEKGNEEAGKIIAGAKEKEESIIREAEKKAGQIIADAEKQAGEMKKNTEAELRLFASQSVEALKSEVTNLITGKIVTDNVKAATADASFMQKTILEIAREWAKNEDITIQTSDAKALTEYFEANAKDILNKGIKIEQVNGKNTSFTLAPADGSYKISFGEDEFINYFKEFLRPQLIEKLF